MAGRVFVVEDDEDLRDSLATLLRLEGYEVGTARNGSEALQQLRESDPPCLILLDLVMPMMDGWELCALLLGDQKLAVVPVVLLSGISDLESWARTLGAVDYLTKPVEFDAVLTKVRLYCR